jgi:hypothetical protein
MSDTYEWFCNSCGVTTYVPSEGGPVACRCEFDPPLQKWEHSDRTRAHAREQIIFRIGDGRREFVGTAADLEGHG